jgi:hypothetical protein
MPLAEEYELRRLVRVTEMREGLGQCTTLLAEHLRCLIPGALPG